MTSVMNPSETYEQILRTFFVEFEDTYCDGPLPIPDTKKHRAFIRRFSATIFMQTNVDVLELIDIVQISLAYATYLAYCKQALRTPKRVRVLDNAVSTFEHAPHT